MKSVLYLTLVFGVATFAAVVKQQDYADVELPEFAKTCSQDDPNLNECIKNTLQEMIPKFQKGYAPLNIPPLDPLVIDATRMQYNNGAIQGTIAMKNVKTFGMAKAEIRDVQTKFDDKTLTSEIEIYFPRILIEGTYKGDIKMNNFKLTPRGHFNISMTDVTTTHKIEGVFDEQNGKRYLRLTSFDMSPDVGTMKMQATGLFPDPLLNQLVVDFVNQYWPSMYQLMLPETRVYWQPIMLNLYNKFLSQVSFDKLLTKNE